MTEQNTLKVIIDDQGGIEMITRFDTRPTPTSQEEFLARTIEANTLIAEIKADDLIKEKTIEVE